MNTENMQMLTKRCDVTHQVGQLDCEVQLEIVMRLREDIQVNIVAEEMNL